MGGFGANCVACSGGNGSDRLLVTSEPTSLQGLDGTRAWKSASNGRGPWWNSGASHMNAAYPKRFFDRPLGLVSLLDTQRRFQHV